MTGGIPTALASLSNLTHLYLNGNELTGEVPAQLGSLSNLTVLSLGGNQLTGNIPTALTSLSKLVTLNLGGNQLTGGIPTQLGSFPNLTQLYLNGNNLEGEIPAQLGDLPNLTVLNLGGNQLTGNIPTELGSLSKLATLNLGGNQLMGSIPTQLGSLSNLTHLYLNGNELTGCIHGSLRNTANHDLDKIGMPFCDGLLSGLTVSQGSLMPSFDHYHTDYSVAVGWSRITVVPAVDHNVSILILDKNGTAIADADDDLEGHQVDFSADIPAIKIRVVSEGGSATLTYTITDLGIRYDANKNGLIERDEVISAIIDYFADRISLEEVVALIDLYFSS